MANTAYSVEFRERVIQCFLNRGTRSARDVAREFGVSHGTLFAWLTDQGISTNSEEAALTPESWSAARKFEAVTLFDSLPEEERGEFVRQRGLTSVHINKWRQVLLAALEKRDQEKLRLEQRVKLLEKELDKKDKALAEAAALLILQKKAQKLFALEE